MRSLLLFPLAALTLSGAGPKVGTFDARHELKVTVPEGAKSVRIWFTMPQNVSEQKIDGLKIDCAVSHKVTTDDHGNQAVFVEIKDPKVKEIAILETFRVTRQEVLGDVDPSHAKPLTDEDRKKFAADL